MIDQILIDGIGATFDDFDLIFTNDSDLPEAEPIQYLLNTPGGGTLDVSEALTGDVQYADIQQTLVFVAGDGKDLVECRHKLVNALSGRLLDYRLSWDADYSFHGRWIFGEVEYSGTRHARFTVRTRTDPWRHKGTQTYRVNAAGGVEVNVPCGRKPVSPTFEVNHRTLVSFGDASWMIDPGTVKIRDLMISGENNTFVLNSYPEYSIAIWANYTDQTWSEFDEKRWFDLASGDLPIQQSPTWEAYTPQVWADLEAYRWLELMYPADPSDEYAVYLQYEWSDL